MFDQIIKGSQFQFNICYFLWEVWGVVKGFIFLTEQFIFFLKLLLLYDIGII